MQEVVVVGAGIAGLAVAVALKRVGVEAVVLERSERLRATGAGISLFQNAWNALDALGVAHKLTSLYSPTNKVFIANLASGAIREVSTVRSNWNNNVEGPRIVHRKVLLEALAEELPAESIRFSSKLISIEAPDHESSTPHPPLLLLHMEDGSIIRAKVLIGCDGVNSVVARWLGLDAAVSSGRVAVRGLSVFPNGHGFPQAYRQFVDTGLRAGFVPLNDKEIYWFFIKSARGEESVKFKDSKSIVRQVVNDIAFKDVPPTFSDVVHHSDLSTVTWAPLVLRYPWDVVLKSSWRGGVTVAGDAMHPMTPDLGQGGCSALEDAVVLGRHIGESVILHNGKLVAREAAVALERYAKQRRWRVAWLITSSFLAGWVQQLGSGDRCTKFIKDVIFYKILYDKIFYAAYYDCGRLPKIPSQFQICQKA